LTEFREHPGRGVSALHRDESGGSHLLQLGSLKWLAEEKVDVEIAERFLDEWMNKGATVVGFSVDCRLAGVFALRDTLKPHAREVIRQLGNSSTPDDLGIYIISGDSTRTVEAIAAELGVRECTRAEVFAEVRPEQKAELVKKLQQRGERVAFVGDGINDAPALEQADLGIAVSRASDIAREAADIVLLRSEIDAVPESLALARATLRTIKQNLFWAFFYNALGVPLAALGFMSPVLCAAAMGVSDLVVIGNALRLRKWKDEA
jgi:Cu+-exporting ATPase